MSDSEVVQLRLKRSLLKEFKELAKGESFTVAEAVRAAIRVGLVFIRANKNRIKSIESGMVSAEDVLQQSYSQGGQDEPKPAAPNHGFPPDYPRDESQALIEWISGTGEAHPHEQMKRARLMEQLQVKVAGLEARLKEIDDTWFSITVHDQKGAEVDQELPFHVFRKVKALADEKEITDEAAFNILLEEYQSNPEPGGRPIKVRFVGPKAAKRAKSPKA